MARNKSVLSAECKSLRRQFVLREVDPETGLFVRLPNARKLSQGVVNELFERLIDGHTIVQPFVVNEVGGKWRLLDGNHRMEAIRKYLAANPTHRVEINIVKYDNLGEQEEKDVFTEWNLGRKQSTNDVVRQYWKDIPLAKHFEKLDKEGKLVVGVAPYPGNTTVAFYRAVGAYLAATKPTFAGGYIGDPWHFIDEAMELDAGDAHKIAAFLSDFVAAFGPWKNNLWSKTTPFAALMKIWYDNYEHFPPNRIQHWWNKRLYNDASARDMSQRSGMGACKYAYGHYLRLLNEGNRAKEIFQPWPLPGSFAPQTSDGPSVAEAEE
ncbi:MAG TPA: hypothetical protein VLJ21_03675 [Candidatus Binatia bacterium]|nr:hypothetical protein [Candidatus Binatia bacterium]